MTNFVLILSVISLIIGIIVLILMIKFLINGTKYFKLSTIKLKEELGIEQEQVKEDKVYTFDNEEL